MKKIIPFFIIGMLVLSGLGAAAIQEQDETNILVKSEKISIAQPAIIKQDGYVTVELQDATQLFSTGKPQLPVITKTFMFPVGTIIEDTQLNIDYETFELDAKIQPSPAPVPLTTEQVILDEEHYDTFDETVYSSTELYPSEPYSIRYGVGINDGEHVTYVNVRCNARYSPANNILKVPSQIEYNIDYTEPVASPFAQEVGYDLLIVTHEKFEEQMLRLKEHKESIGITTKVVTTDTIFPAYNGVEDWEDVKLFIANEVQTQGVQYVMLAGGHKGQTDEFWVPEFRSQNFDGSYSSGGVAYDLSYSCDLYYADLFKYDMTGKPSLSTWDTNGNGIYGEGPYFGNADNPDFYPDIYFGRVPFRYSWEARAYVDKIIEYDAIPANSPAFKKVILCGGDTSPEERYGSGSVVRGIYEGEGICDITADHLSGIGWETYKMYASENGDYQLNNGEEGDGSDEIAPVMNQGCGWVNMQGHANPALIGNHIMDREDFVYYYSIMDMDKFTGNPNGLYPFAVIDGCHNGQWDVTMQQIINAGGINYPRFNFLEFIPTDITSWMVLKENGGAIAGFGNTGLGYGYLNSAYNAGLGGWISPRWAHCYAVQGKEYTGEIAAQGTTDYINNFDIFGDEVDRKTIEERQLIGDPSIRIGGAGIAGDVTQDEEETTPSEYVPATTTSAPSWNVGDSWTYKLNTVDFTMQELDDRGIDLKLSAGNLKMEVVDVSSNAYVTDISSDNIDIDIELIYNSYTEDPTMFALPPVSFKDASLQGQIVWEKDTLAIDDIDITLILDIAKNLDGLPLDLPAFVYSLQSIMSIPAEIELSVDFEDPYPWIQFPLEEGSEWGIPEGAATITIGGSVESFWLRILNFVNNFVPLIPAEFAQYLPNVDIAEVLEDFGVPTEMEIDIFELDEFLRKAPFAVSGQETVNVEAGSYSATRIQIVGGVANMYYSESAKNFVQIYSAASGFLPAISNINLELVE